MFDSQGKQYGYDGRIQLRTIKGEEFKTTIIRRTVSLFMQKLVGFLAWSKRIGKFVMEMDKEILRIDISINRRDTQDPECIFFNFICNIFHLRMVVAPRALM